jgi:diguanylate cyclase (GGDEF)-like protein/PAS domain S-box-containing protein
MFKGPRDAERRTWVLAVDDSETVRQTLTVRLSAHGIDVRGAASGAEALALLRDQTFDLILLDLGMPGLPGIEVLRRIRERHPATELPIIMLTVSEAAADVVEALECGANDYIVKPGELPVLLARIRTQVSLKSATEALRDARRRLERKVVAQSAQLEASETSFRLEHDSRLSTEQELRESERRFRALYDENPCMLFTLDPTGIILSVNRLAAEQLGYQRADLAGRSILDLCYVDDRKSVAAYLASCLELPERLHRWEVRKLSRGGEVFWLRETARPVREPGQGPSILMVCEDVSETYRLSERLSYHTKFDALTGLLNRTSLEERLTQLLESSDGRNVEHALLYLDLDQFKLINDTCGHAAGDELMRQLSRTLKNVVRRRDVLARFGGDEFAVLIEDCAVTAARAVADALKNAVERHSFEWDGRRLPVSVSIGIVPITARTANPAAVLSMADAACYAAKEGGRNRIHIYADDDWRLLTRFGEMNWLSRINEALAENRFHLHAQRITPLRVGAGGDHFEMLLRMRDVNGKVIAPGQFLPAAERYNMAGKLDRWVIETAFGWLRADAQRLEQLYLCSINLSGQSLGDEGMLEFLIERIDSHALPGDKLCFEITETAAISDLNHAVHFVRTLKERGCRFALDDFGSGLSSFAYLKNLPVDFVKIDGIFVRDMLKSSIDLAMVRSINDIGHVMGMETIAEFVETDAIYTELFKVGVDFAQGYAIGRPQPLERWA